LVAKDPKDVTDGVAGLLANQLVVRDFKRCHGKACEREGISSTRFLPDVTPATANLMLICP
jgi:hypothetical protein